MNQKSPNKTYLPGSIVKTALLFLCLALTHTAGDSLQSQVLKKKDSLDADTTTIGGLKLQTLRPGDIISRRVDPGARQKIDPKSAPLFIFADCLSPGKAGMWLLDSLGDTLEKVSSRPGFASWAPDMMRMVCIEPRGRLKILDLDNPGGGIIIPLPKGMKPETPAWSSVGDVVAFVALDSNRVRQIYIVDADNSGGNYKQLTFGKIQSVFPSWSPDGSRILYTSATTPTELHIISLETGESELFYASDSIPLMQTDWSPDGKYIAAVGFLDKNIYIMNADGTDLLNITKIAGPQNPFSSPKFVDHGEFILYSGIQLGSVAAELYKSPITGGVLMGVTKSGDGMTFVFGAPNR